MIYKINALSITNCEPFLYNMFLITLRKDSYQKGTIYCICILSDPKTLKEIEKMRKGVEHIYKKIVGQSHVLLDGRRELCRLQECNLGNIYT